MIFFTCRVIAPGVDPSHANVFTIAVYVLAYDWLALPHKNWHKSNDKLEKEGISKSSLQQPTYDRQCSAVRTWDGPIKLPPQKGPFKSKKTWEKISRAFIDKHHFVKFVHQRPSTCYHVRKFTASSFRPAIDRNAWHVTTRCNTSYYVL